MPHLAGLNRSWSQAAPCRDLSLGCLSEMLSLAFTYQGTSWLGREVKFLLSKASC